jgi:hypothetical protein
MTRLVAAIDGVIGVDTHHDTLAAAVTDMVGGLLAQTAVRADAARLSSVVRLARGLGVWPSLLGGGGCR